MRRMSDWIAGGALLAIALASTPCRADPVEDFYTGKIIKLVVSSQAGGGFDLFARRFASTFGANIPGKPTVIIMNMPGGGGLTMANWAYNIAPRDGTVVAMPLSTVPINQLVLPDQVKYDAGKFNWLGNIEGGDSVIFTWKTSHTKTIADARKNETVMAGTGKNSIIYQLLTLSNFALQTKFKIVLGYTEGRVLAIERGEADGSVSTMQNFPALAPNWFKNKLRDITILASNTETRLRDYPNVPTMTELTTDEKYKKILEFLRLQSATARSVFTPQDVPADRVAALRHAFDLTVANPEFIAEMAQMQIGIDPTSGEKVQDSVRRLLATPPDLVAATLEAFK
jgi:tripartite-type tricarboxylate transporter receptor subunit TctC